MQPIDSRAALPVEPTSRPDCAVCGGNAWAGPRPRTRLCACPTCGTVLNDRSPSRQEEEQIYTTGKTAPRPEEARVGLAQWHWVTQGLGVGAADRPLSVLDIGCGQGGFLRAARDGGARVAGIELDPSGVDACRAQGISVLQGSLFDTGLPPGLWDLVTLWDVLEHLEYPGRALRLILPGLAPGGLLVVRGRNARSHVPCKACYARWRELFRCLRVPDLSTVHRWAFTSQGYVRLMRDAGYTAIRLYPGIPTPGDRFGSLGPRLLGRVVKGILRGAAAAAYLGSRRGLYPFPSVLIVGRKPA